jgi:protein-disulfide isomerase
MSNKREREKRREERLQEETKVESQDRRTRLLQFSAGIVFLAIVVVVVLIVVNSSSSESGGNAAELKEVSQVDKLFTGIPQEGLTLGDPKAPVTLYEYGDLQCPICKAYSEEILPAIFEGQIKNGEAKLVFRNFVIIGPQSTPAGAGALAAGEQGRGWNFLELFYRNQGKENSGYATSEFISAVAKAAGIKDMSKWNEDRKSAKITNEVQETTEQAQRFGFTGTPSFALKGPKTNGIELLGTPGSTETIGEKIEAAA